MARNDPVQAFGQIVSGKQHRRPAPQIQGAQEGRIVAVDGDMAVFVLKEFDDEKHRFGPAPFGRTGTPPQVGDRCLVEFVRGDINRAWIVRWAPAS